MASLINQTTVEPKPFCRRDCKYHRRHHHHHQPPLYKENFLCIFSLIKYLKTTDETKYTVWFGRGIGKDLKKRGEKNNSISMTAELRPTKKKHGRRKLMNDAVLYQILDLEE